MQTLIDQHGQVRFGQLNPAQRIINHQDYDLRNNMDQPIGAFRKKMGFNQFQFIGVTGDDFVLGAAIINLKWVSKCFIYVYRPSTQSYKEYSWLKPFSMGIKTSHEPNGGHWSFKHGRNRVEIKAQAGRRHLFLQCGNELHADICIDETEQYHPLAVCCRAGYNGWVFTQKTTARNFTGAIHWQGQDIPTQDLLASVDWSCGYMRRETFWLWSSLSHTTPDGTKIGFNLAAGVNETSHTENGLWINDELIQLDRADFIFNRKDRTAAWQVTTSDGHINLEFQPEGERKERVNAILIASNFTQLFGRFYGTIKDNKGKEHKIDGAMGFCEDHFAKW